MNLSPPPYWTYKHDWNQEISTYVGRLKIILSIGYTGWQLSTYLIIYTNLTVISLITS
jgi:hypothetical protein